jgi:predicted DNA-binding protein YlxM (UPF0122 family)
LMEPRVELTYLFDFYGALLTENRRSTLAMYLEEDLSLVEIAAQAGISRQAVLDSVKRARRKLEEYEQKLGAVKRHLAISAQVELCREALDRRDIESARLCLDGILRIER